MSNIIKLLSSFLTFHFQASPGQIEAIQGNGLVIGHAYSITAVKEVRTHHGIHLNTL